MNRIFSRINRGQRGQVLITVLILLLMGSLIIGSVLSFVGSELKVGQQYEMRSSQLYAADAGVEYAIWWINQSDQVQYPLPLLEGGSYDLPYLTVGTDMVKTYIIYVGLIDSKTTYQIRTFAGPNVADNESPFDEQIGPNTMLTAIVQLTSGGSFIFDNAVVSLGGDVWLNGGGNVIRSEPPGEGNVFANGDIRITNSGEIYGDVYAHGDADATQAIYITNWGGLISGEVVVNGDPSTSIHTVQPGNLMDASPQNSTRQYPALTPTEIESLRQASYDETFEIYAVTASGDPIANTIQNQGTSSNYYHYGNPINKFGNLTVRNCYVVFDQDVYISGNLTLSGSAYVRFEAGLFVGGQIIMTSGGGDIDFSGPVTAGSFNFDNGMSVSFADDVKILGNFTAGSGGSIPIGGTFYVGGNLSLSGANSLIQNDTFYIAGNLGLSGGSFIRTSATADSKSMYVGGNMSVTGGTQLGVDEMPFILCNGTSITFANGTGSNNVNAAIYAPNANVSMTGNVKLRGAIVSNSLTMAGSCEVIYLSALDGRDDIPGGGGGIGEFTIASWTIQNN